MADKLDFMTELARDVDAKKHGQTSSFGTINDFVPRQRQVRESDYDRENDYENTRPFPREAMTQNYQVPPQPAAASYHTGTQPVYQEEPEQETEEYESEPMPAFSTVSEQPGSGMSEQEEMYGSASGNGPSSFHEEERVKIEKPKFQMPVGMIIGLILAAAVIGFLVWFFALRAKIVMPDFVGHNLSEVSSWAAQNKIDSTALARNYEYSVEYDSDVVISQSPEAGSRIKQSTPITLTVSQGPNPDDPVDFPDISNMTLSELNDWKNENKLTKTKISTEYNTTVEKDAVISYELKNVSENDFTRGSTLTIKVSKGPAPAGQVTVENFVGKSFNDVSLWANTKKIKLVRQDVNSETVDSGMVISQTPASGTAMNEGDTLTVTVSKGKGVKIPNLVGYSKEQLEAWTSSKNNTVTVVTNSVYNEAPLGSVIAQGVAPGTILDAGDVLTLTISLYMPILETNSQAWLGKDYLELRAWCDDVNYRGADIQAGEWGEDFQPIYSDEYPTPGQIIKYACYYGTSDIADGCGRPLNNYSRINYQRSLGKKTSQVAITEANLASLQAIINFCDANKMACTFEERELDASHNPFIKAVINGTCYYNNSHFQEIVNKGDSITVYYDSWTPSSTTSSDGSQTQSDQTQSGSNSQQGENQNSNGNSNGSDGSGNN